MLLSSAAPLIKTEINGPMVEQKLAAVVTLDILLALFLFGLFIPCVL